MRRNLIAVVTHANPAGEPFVMRLALSPNEPSHPPAADKLARRIPRPPTLENHR